MKGRLCVASNVSLTFSTSICLSVLQTGMHLPYFAVCLQWAALSPRTSRENYSAGFQFLFIKIFYLQRKRLLDSCIIALCIGTLSS